MPSDNFDNSYSKDLKDTKIYKDETENQQIITEASLKGLNQFFLRRKKIMFLSFFVFLILLVSKTIHTRVTSPVFQATFSLLIKDPIDLRSKRDNFDKNIFGDLFNSEAKQDIATLISLLKSPVILSDLSKKYNTSIAERLSITLGEGASGLKSQRDTIARGVLNITLKDSNAKRAERILKEVSQLYLKVAYDQNQQRISQVLDFLNQQEPVIQNSSLIAQNELEQFRLKNNVVDPISTLKSMKEKEIEIETQLSQARSLYVPNSQIIVSLENQLKNIKDKFSNKTYFVKDYQRIMQKIKISRDNLQGLIFAKEKFQLEMAKNSVPWTIISQPRASRTPVYPNLKREFLRDIMLASLLGVLLGFLRERFDNVFHNPNELKQLVKKPILVSLPYFERLKGIREEKINLLDSLDLWTKNDDKSKNYERFIFQESFRTLYTTIRFLSTDKQINTIVITSSVPNEGKSTISFVIAKTIADMDKKVLFLDCDLRKSKMHRRIGIDNLIGLSNLITDKDKAWESCVKTVPGNKNLSIITSGIKPPDPTRLLSSLRMREIISQLKDSKKFDYIFIDTPPLLGLSDTPLISNLCDGTILLVSLENLDKNLMPQTLNKLDENKINLLGIISNQMKKPIKSSNTKDGYYGYGYQYGYGNEIYTNYYLNDEAEIEEKNKKNINDRDNFKSKFIKLKSNLMTQTINISNKFLSWLDN